MTDDIKLEHFRNLVALSAADGKIENKERVALSKIAFENGIAPDRLRIMLSKAEEYIFLIPQNQEHRKQQMDDMLDFALVDGEFAKAEQELIRTVGGKLQYTPAEIEKMIQAKLSES